MADIAVSLEKIAAYVDDPDAENHWLGTQLILCLGSGPGDPLNDEYIAELHTAATTDWHAWQVLHWLLVTVTAEGETVSPALRKFSVAVRDGTITEPPRTRANPERDQRMADVLTDLHLRLDYSKENAVAIVADALQMDERNVRKSLTRAGGWGIPIDLLDE